MDYDKIYGWEWVGVYNDIIHGWEWVGAVNDKIHC